MGLYRGVPQALAPIASGDANAKKGTEAINASRFSDETGNGSALGRHAIGQIQRDFVHIAPSPSFGRIVAFDDGMSGRVEMPGSVAMRRGIATSHVATGPAQPQVDPRRTDLEALFAALCAGRHVADRVEMRTLIAHRSSPFTCFNKRGQVHFPLLGRPLLEAGRRKRMGRK